LALTSPTSGDRSMRIVRSWILATEFIVIIIIIIIIIIITIIITVVLLVLFSLHYVRTIPVRTEIVEREHERAAVLASSEFFL
jgi:hypothetical protein